MGFICRPTGLIRRLTDSIRARIEPDPWWIKPVRQRIKPVHLFYIFFSSLISPLKCFFFFRKENQLKYLPILKHWRFKQAPPKNLSLLKLENIVFYHIFLYNLKSYCISLVPSFALS